MTQMTIRHSNAALAAIEPTSAEVFRTLCETEEIRRMRGNPAEMTMDEARAMVRRVRLLTLETRVADRVRALRRRLRHR